MGERAHTPGPWRVSRRYEVGPISDADDQSCGMVLALCDVYGDNRNQDARLIAAAPDLLEALFECEEYFDNRADADCDQDGIIPNKEMTLLAVVRAALAKASPATAAKTGGA